MHAGPNRELVETLGRLGVATADEFRRVRGRVRRLARGLPDFESVWIDALAQDRVLTAYQAAEINAGRGEGLRVGDFIVERPLAGPCFGSMFVAREHESQRRVCLTVVPRSENDGDPSAALRKLVRSAEKLTAQGMQAVVDFGVDAARYWVVAEHVDGESAVEWLVRNGRFPPAVVLEIARQTAAALAACERAGVVHGDISVRHLMVDALGQTWLAMPGLRPIARPIESFADAGLPPWAFDGVAPERIRSGTQSTAASDLFAVGCMWWHLLTGRAALAGATGLGKLRSAADPQIADVRSFAPETPTELAVLVSACTQIDPKKRPASFAEIVQRLGPPTRNGQAGLARTMARGARPQEQLSRRMLAIRHSPHLPIWGAAAAGTALALLVALWPWWGHRIVSRFSGSAQQVAKVEAHEAEKLLPPAATATKAEVAKGPRLGGIELANYEESVGADERESADRAAPAARLSAAGRNGRRSMAIESQAIVVAEDAKVFENVDFVWKPKDASARPLAALIDVQARKVTFKGCTFRAESATASNTDADKSNGSDLPAAVAWRWDGDPNEIDVLATGQLRFENCVIDNLAAGVDCAAGGAIVVEAANTLSLGPGPLVRLMGSPVADSPVQVSLAKSTFRESSGVVEVRYVANSDSPGAVRIDARECVFDTPARAALVLLTGPTPPRQLLRAIHWSGEGSIVGPQTAVAIWRTADGVARAAAEEGMAVDGLVRNQVEFAGAAGDGPAASRIVRWQVPLLSTEPPGIDPERLGSPQNGQAKREKRAGGLTTPQL